MTSRQYGPAGFIRAREEFPRVAALGEAAEQPGRFGRPAKEPQHGVAGVRDVSLSGPRRATARPGRRCGCEPSQRRRAYPADLQRDPPRCLCAGIRTRAEGERGRHRLGRGRPRPARSPRQRGPGRHRRSLTRRRDGHAPARPLRRRDRDAHQHCPDPGCRPRQPPAPRACRLRIAPMHRRLRPRTEQAEIAGIRPDQRSPDSSRPDGKHTSRTERLLRSQRRGLPDRHPYRLG